MVIAKTDYDRAYFGDDPDIRRVSGYTEYKRWLRTADIRDANNNLVFQSTGEFFKDLLLRFKNLQGIATNAKVLELGCAKGFMVEDARAAGIDWRGVDASPWAMSQCAPAILPFVVNADALTYLLTQGTNAYDYIVSFRFIECIDDLEMPALVTAMNKVGRKQVHVIDEACNPQYYNAKTLEDWKAQFAWKKGTILVRNEDFYSVNNKVLTA